jgi:bifunctional DNA-binding transcriptional regulator/antitoxin component of YhaV-PrlF toxin-antitoxin module
MKVRYSYYKKVGNLKQLVKKEYAQPTTKGQVTIPSLIRKSLDITPETLFEVSLQENQVIFKLVPLAKEPAEVWETVVDFSQFSPKGLAMADLQGRLKRWTKSTKLSKN